MIEISDKYIGKKDTRLSISKTHITFTNYSRNNVIATPIHEGNRHDNLTPAQSIITYYLNESPRLPSSSNKLISDKAAMLGTHRHRSVPEPNRTRLDNTVISSVC